MEKRYLIYLVIVLTTVLVPPTEASDPLARILVSAGDNKRIDVPVSIALDGIHVPLDSGLRLEEIKNSKRVPVPSQIEPGYSPRLWWILSGETKPVGERVFELVRGDPMEAPAVEVMRDEKILQILLGNRQVLQYNHASVSPPEGADKRYTRSGFIHPLWSPSGEELTRCHPPDHVHHLGLWNPWTKTVFEGREVDFWNLKRGLGTVRFVRFASLFSGPVFGGFQALQEHVDLSAPGKEKAALNEVWDVRVWKPGANSSAWVVDFTTTQTCASESPLLLKKYRYGGFGFRAAQAWDQGDYLTSEGRTRKDGQGTRARWCNVHGPTAKGPAGILFMSHPQNHEHPEPMRIWSHTPMIFFSFCPIQQADWELKPGKVYVLRYRMYVYDGSITKDAAERLWQDFGRPPKVSVAFE